MAITGHHDAPAFLLDRESSKYVKLTMVCSPGCGILESKNDTQRSGPRLELGQIALSPTVGAITSSR
jgi:hypothetical protein